MRRLCRQSQWSTINVPQLKCWECEQRLNQYLIREKGPNTDAGIIQWKMDLRNGILKIQYFPDRMTLIIFVQQLQMRALMQIQ